MAKKKKKNRNPASSTKSPDEVLKDAERQFSEKNYVRAREGWKRLYKLNPEEHREKFLEVSALAAGDLIYL